jgi:hypothetical protein
MLVCLAWPACIALLNEETRTHSHDVGPGQWSCITSRPRRKSRRIQTCPPSVLLTIVSPLALNGANLRRLAPPTHSSAASSGGGRWGALLDGAGERQDGVGRRRDGLGSWSLGQRARGALALYRGEADSWSRSRRVGSITCG